MKHISGCANENSQLIDGANLELRPRNANPCGSPLPQRIEHASPQRKQSESIPSLLTETSSEVRLTMYHGSFGIFALKVPNPAHLTRYNLELRISSLIATRFGFWRPRHRKNIPPYT